MEVFIWIWIYINVCYQIYHKKINLYFDKKKNYIDSIVWTEHYFSTLTANHFLPQN